MGTKHTVTANTGDPSEGIIVTFTITDGPNAGMSGTGTTDANGVATWSYSSTLVGTDTIQASATFGIDPVLEVSNLAYKTWDGVPDGIPEFPTMFIPVTFIIGLLGDCLPHPEDERIITFFLNPSAVSRTQYTCSLHEHGQYLHHEILTGSMNVSLIIKNPVSYHTCRPSIHNHLLDLVLMTADFFHTV